MSPDRGVKREPAEDERGFNSPKKSPIPASFQKSPLHLKFDPNWASKRDATSSKKKAKKSKSPKAGKSLLNYFSPCPASKQPPPPLQPKQWVCRFCTLLNDALLRNSSEPRTSCEACGALKEDQGEGEERSDCGERSESQSRECSCR